MRLLLLVDLVGSVLRRNPYLSGAVLTLMIVLGLSEGAGILLIVPMLGALGASQGTDTPQKLRESAGSLFSFIGSFSGGTPGLQEVLLIYLLIASVYAIGSWAQSKLSSRLQWDFGTDLSNQLFSTLAHARWLYHARAKSAELVQVLVAETRKVIIAAGYLLSLISSSAFVLVYLCLSLAILPLATILLFSFGAFLLFLVRSVIAKSYSAGQRYSESSSGLFTTTSELLSGMKLVKSYACEDRAVEAFRSRTDALTRTGISLTDNEANFDVALKIGGAAMLAFVIYASSSRFALSSTELIMLAVLFSRLFLRLSSAEQHFQYISELLPAYGRAKEIIAAASQEEETSADVAGTPSFEHSIILREVSFSYAAADGPFVLRNISLAIPFGRITAIVGPSGAGKSTLADIIMGLLAPARGEVLVDGKPLLRSSISAWRNTVGYVPQDPFFFHTSIRENLLWAKPGANEEELFAALKHACFDDVVERFPERLETVVGDRGIRLSGGERQRLAIAQSLLRKPKLLVLDEPTSALDTATASAFMEELSQLRGLVTVLIISHRPSVISFADAIYTLSGGTLQSADYKYDFIESSAANLA